MAHHVTNVVGIDGDGAIGSPSGNSPQAAGVHAAAAGQLAWQVLAWLQHGRAGRAAAHGPGGWSELRTPAGRPGIPRHPPAEGAACPSVVRSTRPW